ncbi:hypothetical protein BU23DRAFT_626152 [Bimuria novae-zelandiae CBS 107.79]|uniref:Uncharacterized protein n=1 Tax=Bimuria novae-zelandiae CBS 107.79 TaxID=1447943 RepID=A0A6A5VHN7_9PLEO|nr:hypothetical protein BU23DRAFT_626152 [Bimuria novae-zelandiae CBS 107.79]
MSTTYPEGLAWQRADINFAFALVSLSRYPLSNITRPSQSQAASRVAMVFLFLKLPAELRNQVYEYAAEIATNKPVHITHVGGTDGNYAALTRVNRQTRKEYLPIYQRVVRAARESTLSLDISDLALWSDTFIKTGNRIPSTCDLQAADNWQAFVSVYDGASEDISDA